MCHKLNNRNVDLSPPESKVQKAYSRRRKDKSLEIRPGSFLRVLDYIAILRPILLMPVWTMILLGYYHSSSEFIIFSPGWQIWRTLLLYSMLMGTVYIINQITDAETDDVNNKLYLVAGGYVNVKLLKYEAVILLLASTLLAICWFRERPLYILLIFISIIIGMAYSIPPVRLKGKPIFDLLANATGYGAIAFFAGWITQREFGVQSIISCIPYIFCVGGAFVLTTLPDLKGDFISGDRTTGWLLGEQKSCIASVILLCMAICSSLILKDYIALISSLFCLPLFIYATLTRRFSAITLAAKSGVLSLSLLTCVVIPYYFILFLITMLTVKWYYKKRFGIEYPF